MMDIKVTIKSQKLNMIQMRGDKGVLNWNIIYFYLFIQIPKEKWTKHLAVTYNSSSASSRGMLGLGLFLSFSSVKVLLMFRNVSNKVTTTFWRWWSPNTSLYLTLSCVTSCLLRREFKVLQWRICFWSSSSCSSHISHMYYSMTWIIY